MSSEWVETTLGNFVRLQRGHDLTAAAQEPGNVPVMGSAGPNGTHSKSLAKGPGVVVGRSGASAGRVHFTEVDYWPHNTCLYVTDFLGNNPRFAFYLLQTLNLGAFNSGSAQPSLNRNFIYSIPLTIPGVDEQNAIVSVLQVLDDSITLLRETNATLEAIAQALFKSWFVDFDPVRAKMAGRAPEGMDEATAALFPDALEDTGLGLVPKGWAAAQLADAVESIFSGGTPDTRRPEFWGGGIPWFSSGETRNTVVTQTEKTITPAGVEGSSTRAAMPGDVLIASAGQGHTRGQTSYCGIDCFINQSVVAVRAGKKSNASWLFFNLRRRYDEMRNLSDSHSSRGSLTTKLLAGMPVVVPSSGVLAAFDDVVSTLISSVISNELKAGNLAALRDNLLPRLISGQLRLPEAQAQLKEALA